MPCKDWPLSSLIYHHKSSSIIKLYCQRIILAREFAQCVIASKTMFPVLVIINKVIFVLPVIYFRTTASCEGNKMKGCLIRIWSLLVIKGHSTHSREILLCCFEISAFLFLYKGKLKFGKCYHHGCGSWFNFLFDFNCLQATSLHD